jgi:hypothetical protein
MSDWLDNFQVILICVAQLFGTIIMMMTHRYAINYKMVTRLADRMHSIPRSSIGDSANKYIEIEGEGFSPSRKALRSPFSDIECVFWAIKVVSDKSRHVGRVIYSQDPFFIRDGTGSALICPGPLTEIFLGRDHKTIHPGTSSFIKKHQDFLNSINLRAFDGDFEFQEIVIPAGAPIYATGNLIGLPGRNHNTLANALKESDLKAAHDFLNKHNISSVITGEPNNHPISITGKPLPSLSCEPSLEVDHPIDPSDKCHYLYGTPSKRLFISSVTETMIDDNEAVVVYDNPPIWSDVFFISLIIMGFTLYKFL